ncbi:MAG: rhodanese-like domain-containing protein [Bacteroidales bacterium]|nr:rhodanese-like domain-containing protein [Bacteroidales bacterium]
MSINEKLKNTPECQDFQLNGVRHISASGAHGLLQEQKAILIDVRRTNEVEVEHVSLPGVMLYPMEQIIDHLQDIPGGQLVIVMDSRGERGTKVARLLNMQGFRQVANLDGGLVQWKNEGLPVENILPDACGGCCGCN